ncbi:MAG: hypothetical protein NZ826_05145 [Thermodesulfovibrio sp.]|nr:hypothetical protein [Thermodesulfovibrio sp.]
MNEKETKEKYSEGIDLYELILLLKRRIKYIIGVLIIGLIIGGGDIYQSRASLWVDSLLMQSILESLKTTQINGEGKFSFYNTFFNRVSLLI